MISFTDTVYILPSHMYTFTCTHLNCLEVLQGGVYNGVQLWKSLGVLVLNILVNSDWTSDREQGEKKSSVTHTLYMYTKYKMQK